MADEDYYNNPTLGGIPSTPMPAGLTLGYGAPYGYANGGNQSVLSSPERQAKAGQAYDQALDSQLEYNRKNKGEQVAADIFGNVVGPALAAFGNKGVGEGGLALIQEAENKRKEHRAEAHQKLADTAAMVNSITSFVDHTSPESQKALAATHKAHMDELKQRTAQDKEARLAKALGMKKDQWEKLYTFKERQQTALEGHRGLQDAQGQQRIDNLQKVAKASLTLRKMIAERAQELMDKNIDVQHDDRMLALQHNLMQHEQSLNLGIAKHNAHIQQLMAEPDPKNPGKKKYEGLELVPMPGAQMAMDAGGGLEDVANHPDIQASGQAMNALLQEMQPQQQAGAPQQPGAPAGGGGGVNIQGAAGRLQAIMSDPKAPPEMKRKAADDFRIFLQHVSGGQQGGQV